MEVREAVARAKSYVRELYSEEDIRNIGLEEVSFLGDRNIWSVTIGFARPWQEEGEAVRIRLGQIPVLLRRTFKVVEISDATGEIVSLKNREGLT